MNFPSDTIQGSPTFHTEVKKQPDGSFVATTNVQDIAPQKGRSESEAILKARYALEKWFGDGGTRG